MKEVVLAEERGRAGARGRARVGVQTRVIGKYKRE